jgi:hypothetical protein
MEYLSSGKPVIAPKHTAMLDYLNPQSSFIVNSYPEPSPWPHDPTSKLKSVRFRMDWDSMRQHFLTSYDIAQNQPETYQNMSQEAWISMYKFCHLDKVSVDLNQFLQLNILQKNNAASTKIEEPA